MKDFQVARLWPRSPKWQEAYENYMAHLWSCSNALTTLKNNQSVLRRFFNDPSKTPNKYTQSDVRRFIDSKTHGRSRRGTTPKASTRNIRLGIIASFYSFCQDYLVLFRGKLVPILTISPTRGIKAAKTSNDRRAFEEEEIPIFFAAIPRNNIKGLRDYALFLGYFYTGRRLSEFCNLLWEDIQENVRYGQRIGASYRWEGKGHLGKDDEEEIPPPVWEAIKHYLAFSGRYGKMRGKDPVFSGVGRKATGQPLHQTYVERVFSNYARKAGLEGLTIHSFRYTAGIEEYLAAGNDVLAAQRKLRHRKLETTGKYLEKRRHPTEDQNSGKILQKYGAL